MRPKTTARLFLAVLAVSTIGFALAPASASEPGYCAPPGSGFPGLPIWWMNGVLCGGTNCEDYPEHCNEPREPLPETQAYACALQDVPGPCETALPRVQIDGGITGTVTDSSGGAIAGACVSAWSDPPSEGARPAGAARTGSDGTYRIGDLSRDVRVEFVDCREGSSLRTEWYDNAGDFNSATTVSVAVGSDHAGINAQLGYS